MRRTIVRVVCAMSLLAGTSALAQQSVQQPAQSAKKPPDPNEIVCEKQKDTGSRLAMHKVCMTRGEWAEQRRLDRQAIEKIQVQRPMSN